MLRPHAARCCQYRPVTHAAATSDKHERPATSLQFPVLIPQSPFSPLAPACEVAEFDGQTSTTIPDS